MYLIYSFWARYVCSICFTRHIKPWIDKHVRTLQRKRNKLFKKQLATHHAKDISHYRHIKAKVRKAERQAYWKHVENILDIGDPESDHQPNKQAEEILVFYQVVKER